MAATTYNAPKINPMKVMLRLKTARAKRKQISTELVRLSEAVLDMQDVGVLDRTTLLVYADCLEENGLCYAAAATRDEAQAFPENL